MNLNKINCFADSDKYDVVYITSCQYKNADEFNEYFSDPQEAIDYADRDWRHMTESERAKCDFCGVLVGKKSNVDAYDAEHMAENDEVWWFFLHSMDVLHRCGSEE